MGDTMADNCLLRKRGRRLGVFYHTVREFRCGETESSKLEKKEKKRRLNRRYVLDSYKLEGYLSSRSLQVGSDIGYSVIPPVLICSVVLPHRSCQCTFRDMHSWIYCFGGSSVSQPLPSNSEPVFVHLNIASLHGHTAHESRSYSNLP